MANVGFEFIMLEEAKAFVLGLSASAMKKVLYNIQRVAAASKSPSYSKS